MNRKDFLKNGIMGLGTVAVAPALLTSFAKKEEEDFFACTLSPTETNGPYPIISPTLYVRSNIVVDRTGVTMTLTLTIQNTACTLLQGVLVDVWHCDKDGDYSQYGSYANANFLRGRQTTDANGQVTFTSIFPGWYSGRAPHIHVEVLSATGTSLLVTQLAFPVATYTTVYASTGYNGAPDTSNSADNIFSDSLSANMVDSATGSVAAGYTITKAITVNGTSASIGEFDNANNQFSKLTNYPNPFTSNTTISFSLTENADVFIIIFDITGKQVDAIEHKNLNSGLNEINYSGSNLQAGTYFYKLQVSNKYGMFSQVKKMIKK